MNKKYLSFLLLFFCIKTQLFGQKTPLETMFFEDKVCYVYPRAEKQHAEYYGSSVLYWGDKDSVALFPKDGCWIQYYEVSPFPVAQVFEVRKGVPTGAYKRYNTKSEIQEEGKLHCGLKVGTWTRYTGGRERNKSVYQLKQFDSAYFHKNYVNYWNLGGIKHGYYYEKTNSAVILEEGYYKNNQKDSIWTDYYLHNKDSTSIAWQGEIDCKIPEPKGKYPNGWCIDREWKQGTWKAYFKNGKMESEKNYRNDTMCGNYKLWNEAGALLYECVYKNDSMIQGNAIWYDKGEKYAEGKLYKGRVKFGDWAYYYPNGKLKAQGKYKMLQKTVCSSASSRNAFYACLIDNWTFWDSTGNKIAEGRLTPVKDSKNRGNTTDPYYRGRRMTEWKYWQPNGLPVSEKDFQQHPLLNEVLLFEEELWVLYND